MHHWIANVPGNKIPVALPYINREHPLEIVLTRTAMPAIKCDAYVLPHATDGICDSALAREIRSAGAELGWKTYALYREVHPMLAPGCVRIMKSRGGNALDLIHAVTNVGSDVDETFSAVALATFNALVAAHERGRRTIVFPLLEAKPHGVLERIQSGQAILGGIKLFYRHTPGATLEIAIAAPLDESSRTRRTSETLPSWLPPHSPVDVERDNTIVVPDVRQERVSEYEIKVPTLR